MAKAKPKEWRSVGRPGRPSSGPRRDEESSDEESSRADLLPEAEPPGRPAAARAPDPFSFSENTKAQLAARSFDARLILALESETREYIFLRDYLGGAPSNTQIHAALEEIERWAGQGLELFGKLDGKTRWLLLEELYRYTGSPERISELKRTLRAVSRVAIKVRESVPQPIPGRPADHRRGEFVRRVRDLLVDAGYQPTSTRRTELSGLPRRGAVLGRDGMFVAVLRILFESAGENRDPHKLAEKSISLLP